ncbi:hypothetical protein Pmani_034470 [Petrolisthes manimaculis]|uniref:Uncharacterized protein n=1 Tax=Petrolisthes manimaculis TaxID=1843537 RepID=A0AAE1TRK6_9EUCA|nr:hypothetical protein Pmani_034470 [Petrolisthes manimaculis]
MVEAVLDKDDGHRVNITSHHYSKLDLHSTIEDHSVAEALVGCRGQGREVPELGRGARAVGGRRPPRVPPQFGLPLALNSPWDQHDVLDPSAISPQQGVLAVRECEGGVRECVGR